MKHLRGKVFWVLQNVSGSRKGYKGSCLYVDCEVWVGLQWVLITGRNSYQQWGQHEKDEATQIVHCSH